MLIEERKGPFKAVTSILERSFDYRLFASSKITLIRHRDPQLYQPRFSFLSLWRAGGADPSSNIWKVTTKQTGVIDLGSNFLSTFRDTTQNEIRRTLKDPHFQVAIVDVGDEDFALYQNFERAIGRRPFKRDVFGQCKAALVSLDGNLLSGVYFYPTLPVARVRSIFSSRKAADKDLRKKISWASRRAIYEVCLWVQAQGGTGLDLASVNTSTEAKARQADFKLSFNPRLITEYHYEYKSWLYRQCENFAQLFMFSR